uniref:Uncharacterized protein n=1 Tax=Arundo donax TaxID=35708 RepID=A0A0A8Y4W8_ARUDO
MTMFLCNFVRLSACCSELIDFLPWVSPAPQRSGLQEF